MSKVIRKNLEKIFKKLDSLAKKGRDNIFEYYKYVDELIDKEEYSNLEQALFYYYDVDIIDYIDINEMKRKTWPKILFQTKSTFQTKIKKLYDDKNVYQVGINIYTTGASTNSVLLGQIREIDSTSIEASKYYYLNREFAQKVGILKTFLEVTKNGIITLIAINDTTLTEEQNLYNRYTISVDLLLEREFVLATGYWNDMGYWYDDLYWID